MLSTTGTRGQGRLFAVEDMEPRPWPRGQAVALFLVVWSAPTVLALVATAVTGNPWPLLGTPVSLPWAWGATKVVRFLLTGDPWELARGRAALAVVDRDA